MNTRISLACAVALIAASGCASYSGSSLSPGVATQGEVRRVMGEPAAVHRAPDGAAYAESWEYPHGPIGRHTYMARFDSGGKLVQIEQVLTLKTVTRVKIGESTRDDVRRILGRPAFVFPERLGGESWDYAAYAADGLPRKVRLSVTFDTRGIANAAGESPDPEEFSINEGPSS